MTPILVLAIAYLLGAIPFGFVVVKWVTGSDVRKGGSGNIGATNVLRTTGPWAGILTLLLDIGKGYLAVWLAGRLTAYDPFWMSAAALAVMLGHVFPVFLHFQGGKAVASFVGAFLCLAPLGLLCSLVVFVAVVAWTRYISLGSIIAAASLPLALWIVVQVPWSIEIASILAGALIIYKHSGNIARLRAGTENVFRFKGSKH